jgi:ABC-type glutathione transport system ATPase component
VELIGLAESRLRAIRGRRIAMIMQSPRASLNPTLRLGDYLGRTLRLHGVARTDIARRGDEAMREVLLDPELLRRYPHEVSGGQAQRFAIALVLALGADLVIADECTSALDVTVQAEVVALLRRLRDTRGTGQLFISHDLAVVGQLADRLVVMHSGSVVETGPAADVVSAPRAAYTQSLVAAIPRIGRSTA